MLSWMKQLVEAFGLPVILTLLATFLLWLRWRTVGEVLKDSNDVKFDAYREQLSESRWTTLYHQALQRWLLLPLVRWIGDSDQYARNQGSLIHRKFGIQPWTPRAYVLCLEFALVYPFAMMFLLWVICGGRGLVGQWVLLPESGVVGRLAIILTISGICLVAILRMRYGKQYSLSFIAAAGVLSGVAIGAFAGAGAGAVALAVITALSIAAVGAVSGSSSVAFVGAGAAAGACSFISAFGVVGVGNFATVFLETFVFAFLSAAIFFTLIFLGKSISNIVGTSRRRGLSFLLLWLGYNFFILMVIGALVFSLNLLNVYMIFCIFLAGLPLLNALWDWISLGMSRGLLTAIALGKQTGWNALLWALLDVVLAVVFLVAIVLTVTAALAMYNKLAFAGGHEAVVDLGVLFSGIREDPMNRSHYWVYAMFLSTLIPTFIHAVAASAAGIQAVSEFTSLKRWRQRAAAQLERDAVGRAGAQLYLTFVPLLAIVVPIGFIYVLYLIIPAHGAPFGWWLLDIAEATASWIGGVSSEA